MDIFIPDEFKNGKLAERDAAPETNEFENTLTFAYDKAKAADLDQLIKWWLFAQKQNPVFVGTGRARALALHAAKLHQYFYDSSATAQTEPIFGVPNCHISLIKKGKYYHVQFQDDHMEISFEVSTHIHGAVLAGATILTRVATGSSPPVALPHMRDVPLYWDKFVAIVKNRYADGPAEHLMHAVEDLAFHEPQIISWENLESGNYRVFDDKNTTFVAFPSSRLTIYAKSRLQRYNHRIVDSILETPWDIVDLFAATITMTTNLGTAAQ